MLKKEAKVIFGFSEKTNPTPKGVKERFRKLTMLHHPDRGGNAEVFNLIIVAKNILLANKFKQDSSITISLEDAFKGIEVETEDGIVYIPRGVKFGQKLPEGFTIWVKSDGKNVDYSWQYCAGDMRFELLVSPFLMMTGGFHSFELFGETIKFRITPGHEANAPIMVKNKGYWKVPNGNERGDLIIRLVPDIRTSYNSQTEGLSKFLKEHNEAV